MQPCSPTLTKELPRYAPNDPPPPLHAARPPIQTWQLALLDLQTLTLPSKPRPCLPSNLQTLTLHAWLGVLRPRPITAPRLPLFLPLPSHRITAAQSQDYCHRIIEHHDMTLQAKPDPCPLPPLPPAPTPSPAPQVVVSAPVKDAERPVLNIVYGCNEVGTRQRAHGRGAGWGLGWSFTWQGRPGAWGIRPQTQNHVCGYKPTISSTTTPPHPNRTRECNATAGYACGRLRQKLWYTYGISMPHISAYRLPLTCHPPPP